MTRAYVTDTRQRSRLALLVGRVVTAEATYGNEARELVDGRWVYYLCDVFIYPGVTEEHLWVELPAQVRRRLADGQRFSFRAEVVGYVRGNGSRDFTLEFRELVKG